MADDDHVPLTEEMLTELYGRACDGDACPVDTCRLVTEVRRLSAVMKAAAEVSGSYVIEPTSEDCRASVDHAVMFRLFEAVKAAASTGP